MSMWLPPKIWSGGDVWIIGGGPSITAQFAIPKKVEKSVRNGVSLKAYSKYMEVLHDKHIIGINVAYMLGDWVDFTFFGDKNFGLKHNIGLRSSKSIKVSCNSYTKRYKFIKYMPKDNSKPSGICTKRGYISWNLNSGAASISLAVQLGAKRIFLLGFDMYSVQGNTHWHSEYQNNPIDGNDKSFNKKEIYPLHIKGFKTIKADADNLGIEIFNVNPNSKINEFERITMEEALCK